MRNTQNIEQVVGREAETATLLSASSVNSKLLGGGFRPRQLRRSVSSLKLPARRLKFETKFMISSQYKIYSLVLTVFSVFTFAQCAKSQEKSFSTGSTDNAPAIQGTAAGEVEHFKFDGGNLKDELSRQSAPKVWLVFLASKSETQSAETDSGETTTPKVELPIESVEIISSLWKTALMSRYSIYIAGVSDSENYQQEISKIFNAGEVARSKLRKLEINAPDGKRKISNDEAGEIIRFINISAIDTISPFKKQNI